MTASDNWLRKHARATALTFNKNVKAVPVIQETSASRSDFGKIFIREDGCKAHLQEEASRGGPAIQEGIWLRPLTAEGTGAGLPSQPLLPWVPIHSESSAFLGGRGFLRTQPCAPRLSLGSSRGRSCDPHPPRCSGRRRTSARGPR